MFLALNLLNPHEKMQELTWRLLGNCLLILVTPDWSKLMRGENMTGPIYGRVDRVVGL